MKTRREIKNKFQGETLVRRSLEYGEHQDRTVRIAPNLNVVKIGGHGTVDFGSTVLLPLLDEIRLLKEQYEMLVVVGGGVRVRHVMDVGIDLGMPTGILAELSGDVSSQNAKMVAALLSEDGGIRIPADDIMDIPMLVRMGLLPVMAGTPPYSYFEEPSPGSYIPQHRTDTGAFLAAEVIGAKTCTLLKNVDGLFTENPFVNPEADLIKEITAGELLSLDMDDLVLERKVVELLMHAKNIREIRIINGHERGTLERALKGENPGTLITAD
ncbi:uridylate kinase [Methanogenium sp. S4BF]|uniref:amino acid kinase family protein n=1 Tax=Methanogenium sp. S4BF TaxID=1789226 RepID=UPI002417F646|nr:uridylate kinase [Methanogenium sp. S4BF]WFN33687.1 uridylate kinase [Methanogenium sp. S4BF]